MCCQWQQSLCLEFQPSEPRSGITGDHYSTLPLCTKTFYVVSREKSSKWKWELGKGPLHTGRRRGGHSRFTWDRLSLPCARGAWCSLSPAPLLRAVHRDCHPRAGGWGEDLARRQRGRRAGTWAAGGGRLVLPPQVSQIVCHLRGTRRELTTRWNRPTAEIRSASEPAIATPHAEMPQNAVARAQWRWRHMHHALQLRKPGGVAVSTQVRRAQDWSRITE